MIRGGCVTLSEICKATYPACPTIKSQSAFIDGLFEACGCKLYESTSYKKQLFNGSKPFSNNLKSGLPEIKKLDTLIMFFENNISNNKLKDMIAAFGIPETGEVNKKALSIALAIQFKAIIDADADCGEDILLLEYQKHKIQPQESSFVSPASVLYPGDQYYIKTVVRPIYHVNTYDVFQHTWDFENVGTQMWKGRKLYFLNHDAVRPRADLIYIDIPDTPPNKSVKLTVDIDARGFEGESECKWIMVDSDNNDCFPNSSIFSFVVCARFEYKKADEFH